MTTPEFPSDSATSIPLPGTELPYRLSRRDGRTRLTFDSRGTPCPVPMVHAMAGLEWVAAQMPEQNSELVMINGCEPAGLYERVAEGFSWQATPRDDGSVTILFTPRPGRAATLDFTRRHCRGG